jgi:hypothetical protein
MDCVRPFFHWIPRIFEADNHPKAESTKETILEMGHQGPPAGGSRKISFNVSDQYEIQDVIGEGAYGVVWYVV